jgi:class 3 adenylate cyclase
MTTLDARSRAGLPDSAFAYIDSRGRRRLPLNDESHVRNALARFNQTTFEDEVARDTARTKLLRAAKKYGIVPVGFMTGQLLNARARAELAAQSGEALPFPTGMVTFLYADIEDSTGLLRQLEGRYGDLLRDVRRLLRVEVRSADGRVVDMRADELFAVFKRADSALAAAIAIQRKVLGRVWPARVQVRLREGLHTGRPTLADTGYVGLAVHVAARVCHAAHGGQIVLSHAARDAIARKPPPGVTIRDLGQHRLSGLPGLENLYQADGADLPTDFPEPRMTIPPSA